MADVHRVVMCDLVPESLVRYPVTASRAVRVAQYLGLPPDEMALTPGSDSALRLICQHHARRGGAAVLLQDPNYVAVAQSAAALGLTVERVTAPRADPAAQGAALVDLAARTTGALIAVSVPNGLSGGSMDDSYLGKLADLAYEREHLLIIDSCYQAFAGPLGAHFARRGDAVFVVQSMSKSHGLAGARVAVTAASASAIAALGTAPLEHAVSEVALRALLNAIDHHDEFVSIWAEVRRCRERAIERTRAAGWEVLDSDANFVAAAPPHGLASARLVEELSRAGYRVKDLGELAGLANCIRFTVGDDATTDAFLDVLLNVADELRNVPGDACATEL
ncbi:aminotransferase class I/II-fold pyridoxal phosphate-dependent enzyme [Lentzea sp. NPDC004782]|uniref:aminotransferase class I/II-fold pyridoxal phosphate-dependent enzyme n=1 Tax=Lentzea sp. NPDC004782 TaxID=3154458 RepID=UPI0033B1DA82